MICAKRESRSHQRQKQSESNSPRFEPDPQHVVMRLDIPEHEKGDVRNSYNLFELPTKSHTEEWVVVNRLSNIDLFQLAREVGGGVPRIGILQRAHRARGLGEGAACVPEQGQVDGAANENG